MWENILGFRKYMLNCLRIMGIMSVLSSNMVQKKYIYLCTCVYKDKEKKGKYGKNETLRNLGEGYTRISFVPFL